MNRSTWAVRFLFGGLGLGVFAILLGLFLNNIRVANVNAGLWLPDHEHEIISSILALLGFALMLVGVAIGDEA